MVYQDRGAIPPARLASRSSSAERKADVTPCFWVQTIGIQERGAARLREPTAPSSACPATFCSVPTPQCFLGPPSPGRRPGCTLTSPGVSPAGGHGVGGVALPTRGGSAPPHPSTRGCPGAAASPAPPRARGFLLAGCPSCHPTGVGRELGGGGSSWGASGRPTPTCRGPVSFPAGTAGAGCLLAHPTCRCTPAGSVQEPRESGARGCGQAGTCAPLPTARPALRAKPPLPPRAGVRGAWGGMGRCGVGWMERG